MMMYPYATGVPRWKVLIGLIILIGFIPKSKLSAEGSVDFINYPGYRLFYSADVPQQMKVYAEPGEFLNIGASHVGISGGFIRVFKPDGTLAGIFDDSGPTANLGIIHTSIQERNGPTGGGSTNGAGYRPGVIPVGSGEGGVWTVTFEFPSYQNVNFNNILNNAAWERGRDQPTIRRVVLAWDITVSKNAAGNSGGQLLKGRVFSNEYISIVSQNGNTTSPSYYILTKTGLLYRVDFKDTDPWGFPIASNSRGIVKGDRQPSYTSQTRPGVTRSDNPENWDPSQFYLYELQAADTEDFINNKVFFNPPDPNMPATATVTDIFRQHTYATWLYRDPESLDISFAAFELSGRNETACLPQTIEPDMGANFIFESNRSGAARLDLDLNNNGQFTDPVDRTVYQEVHSGRDTIFWDGKDGLGQTLAVAFGVQLPYQLRIRSGEVHILMADVENNPGGISVTLTNDLGLAENNLIYYDHSPVSGPKSGGVTTGEPKPVNEAYVYQSNWGNEKILDYWTFVEYKSAATGSFVVNVAEDCAALASPDSDQDGIYDAIDIDDDNDGIPDKLEFCNGQSPFSCLPGGFAPDGDEDGDGIPNYRDADDAAVASGCPDADQDGQCDLIAAAYDTDGDNVPDHLDLDSDNDGISDLVEAGHGKPDADGNGVIDGPNAEFGANGLYNLLGADPDDPATVLQYEPWDWDEDGVPDHDDLDSDNDGIHDVTEANHAVPDSNGDGMIDNGQGAPPKVSTTGLAPLIDPVISGKPIPFPYDHDGDGVPDWHDLDSDNDLIQDVEEAGLTDTDNNGLIGNGAPEVDALGRAVSDMQYVSTSKPVDTDADLVGDWRDLDSDNDAINDVIEAKVSLDPDKDGVAGTGMPETDIKGRPTRDPVARAEWTATSKPNDEDGDGVRDYRDLDTDNDGIYDVLEAGKPDPDSDGIVGSGIPKVDPQGRIVQDAAGAMLTTTSFPLDTDEDELPDFRSLDSDSDGISDVYEADLPDPDMDGIIGKGVPETDVHGVAIADPVETPYKVTSNVPDTDGDRQPDFRDLDSDGDGLPDQYECPAGAPCRDGDGDQMDDFRDTDRDNDTLPDKYECESGVDCPDTDGDGILDVDDLDTDDDGILDVAECPAAAPCGDADQDGIADWRDYQCNPFRNTPQIEGLEAGGMLCAGQEMSITAYNSVALEGNIQYTLMGPDNFSISGQMPAMDTLKLTLPNLNAANQGAYQLVFSTLKGCPSPEATFTLSVLPAPETPALSVEDDIVCEGELIEFNSSIYSGAEVRYEWFINRSGSLQMINTTSIPTLFIDSATMSTSGKYVVKVIQDGCPSLLSNAQDILVLADETIPAEVTNLSGGMACEGSSVELFVPVLPGVTYQWVGPDGFSSTTPNTVVRDFSAAKAGVYYAYIQTKGCNLRSAPLSLALQEQAKPKADRYSTKFNEPLTIANFLDNDGLAGNTQWKTTISQAPQHGTAVLQSNGGILYTPANNFHGTDILTYEICNQSCLDMCAQALIRIDVSGADGRELCFVPNVITPNGDGNNDAFEVPCLADAYPNNELSIFNRRGDKVFEAKNYRNNWKGTYQGAALPAGTYYYLLRLQPGDADCLEGYFTITY